MTPVHLDTSVAVMLSWLMTYAIHSTILLALAALVAIRFADEHAWLDVLWKTALLGPLVTASIQLGLDTIPLGGRWPIHVSSPAITTPTVTPVQLAPQADTSTSSEAPTQPAAPTPRRSERSDERAESTTPTNATPTAVHPVTRWWPAAAVSSWLIVAAIGLVRFVSRLLRLHRVIGSGPEVAATHLRGTIDALREAADEREPIRLTTSQACAVPLALAGRRIVLPERFLAELDDDHQQAALAHEIAHIVRRDPAWRILAGMLERVFFFQPLNRLARARLCDSAEFICDQWAVQQTRSPLALARCLSIVASWATPSDDARVAEASTMARSDSPFVRRVQRILNEPADTARRSVIWLALPLAIVVAAAPLVSAGRLAEAATANSPETASPAQQSAVASQKDQPLPPRVWTAGEITRARNQLRLQTSPRPGDPLDARWRWALNEASRQSLNSFWIVYTFATPTHAQDLMITDTIDGSMVSLGGHISQPNLVPLGDLLEIPAAASGTGNVTVLLHYHAARSGAIDRAGYRSTQLGFPFGRTPVFSLGVAPDSESFTRVEQIFADLRNEKVQRVLIELASLHSNSDVVLPFLTRLVELSNPVAIREEAAEGFGHHHDPRSVETLLRVAQTDTVSDVRSEAAETIGEVQTPQSIAALTELATNSPDEAVRREAAEAFGDQPPGVALPAIERLINTTQHEEVLTEAVEALGSIHDPRVPDLLVRIATGHQDSRAQQEAVETLGDVEDTDTVPALARIAWEHPNVTIQREAVETLGDRKEPAAVAELERIVREHPVEDVQAEAIETLGDREDHRLNPLVVEQARSGRSQRVRREALDAIANIASGTSDVQTLDKAQETIEYVIFNDPDQDVRKEAIDALDGLPRDRASRILRYVIERHPDPELRQEAKEHRREKRDQ